jgi:phosphatidylethanolamine-binding protein (PEBP) family uncharacterized protein
MRTALLLPLAVTLAACGGDDAAGPIDAPSEDGAAVDSAQAIDAPRVVDGPLIDGPPAPFALTSTAIAEGGVIPVIHSCRGANTSPPLTWTGGPTAPGYALVFTDITTPANPFLHSIIWDIPGNATELPVGVQKVYLPPTPAGAKQPLGYDGQTRGYLGPCPGSMHRYEYALVAVDVNPLPGLSMTSTRFVVRDAITAHAVAAGRATLTATFTP